MKKAIIIILFLYGLPYTLLGAHTAAVAPDTPVTSRILFIFDASHSMAARWQSDNRLNIARHLINEMLDSLEGIQHVQLALRVFGHQKVFPPQDCNDTRLEVPFADDNIPDIRYKLRTLKPKGTTPIALSLEKAADDFPSCDNCRNIIILITDGIEECGADPCEISRKLQETGIILKPFVIGIGHDFRNEFDCVGHYFDASSESEFEASLNIIISQVLGKTTSQVNLLDVNGRPTETNVPITFFNQTTGGITDNIIHTLNHRGLPDTLYILDPFVTYDMKIHTTPAVWVRGINVEAGRHNIVAADTPTGSLLLTTSGQAPSHYQAILREKGDSSTLKAQHFGHPERYLVGSYDIEVLSLPRIYISDISIRQNHMTRIEIPQPGIAVIRLPAPGHAMLFVEGQDDLEAIFTLREYQLNQTLHLQPGNYRLVYRSRVSTNTGFSTERRFQIESGSSVAVTIN